ncbi:hypothetical protein RFI_02712 [Reticulomyxa filosa]|uniref:Uncharacterized protein n=1 Tax=Reticulomyxa filosa TaxID=46433 RepID=X6P893_RETFI|nr:hypothetical protein RFI_02712 [Reticulomyxa filosa]|eukprot:ETO34381.1 hypothetical protein RFI_02712 [Reticulomyxa filosa]
MYSWSDFFSNFNFNLQHFECETEIPSHLLRFPQPMLKYVKVKSLTKEVVDWLSKCDNVDTLVVSTKKKKRLLDWLSFISGYPSFGKSLTHLTLNRQCFSRTIGEVMGAIKQCCKELQVLIISHCSFRSLFNEEDTLNSYDKHVPTQDNNPISFNETASLSKLSAYVRIHIHVHMLCIYVYTVCFVHNRGLKSLTLCGHNVNKYTIECLVTHFKQSLETLHIEECDIAFVFFDIKLLGRLKHLRELHLEKNVTFSNVVQTNPISDQLPFDQHTRKQDKTDQKEISLLSHESARRKYVADTLNNDVFEKSQMVQVFISSTDPSRTLHKVLFLLSFCLE